MAMVVHGLDGLDEITLCAPTQVSELKNGWVRTYIFDPKSIGLDYVEHSELVGGDVTINKEITMDIISGKGSPKADLVYLNTGAALCLYGLTDSIKSGYDMAKKIAQSGKAEQLLKKFAETSRG